VGDIKKQPEVKHKFSVRDIALSIKNFFLSSQSIAGIEIGNKYIKIVQFQKNRTEHLLANYRVRALPSQAKENLQERKKLISGFVKEFVSESRIKTKVGRLAFWGQGSYLFSLTVPEVSEKNLKGIVDVELKKRLPFQVDLTNIISNFFITEKTSDEKGAMLQVTCIAMDKHFLNENISILKDIGMRPTTINVIPDALGNLVSAIDKESNAVGILDMGAKDSTFNFYKKGMLLFSRQIPMGGEQFTVAIMKAMSSLGMNNVTPENAEKVKRQCGIPLDDEIYLEYFTDFGVIKGNQIAMGLRSSLERFNTEITRTINYYYRTFRVNSLDKLYLTGGSSRLKNIAKLLEANLQNLNEQRLKR